jgi:transcription elongation factor GreA
MASEKVPMTVLGKKLLDEELKHLMTVERPTVIKAIEVARSHGDLSENADYSAAKERQSFIEGRIQEINAKIAMAQVIDTKAIQSDKVVFGAIVKLFDTGNDEEITYQIVGVDEADVKNGKIGVSSPVARALIGKQVGDEVTVNAPKGNFIYEILEISYS